MSRVLGYGGVANTNGSRNFAGRVAAPVSTDDKLIQSSIEFTGMRMVSSTWTKTTVRVYQRIKALLWPQLQVIYGNI